DHAGGRSRGEGRSETAARGRVQAANIAVRFSRHGRRGIEIAAESQARDGAGDYYGSDERERRGPGGAIRGRDAGGRAEHAEFHAAESTGKMRATGAAEARIEQHGEGVADVRGIHHRAWESGCDFVRAGNSDIRNGDAKHLRHRGNSRAEIGRASCRERGSVSVGGEADRMKSYMTSGSDCG